MASREKELSALPQTSDPQRGQRGQFRRLHHDRAAACQGRRELPHADHQRKIPRHDRGDHAHRLPHGIGQRIIARGDHIAADLVGPTRVIGQRVDGRREILTQRRRNRLAAIQALDFDDLVSVLFEKLRPSQKNVPAFRGTHGAPGTFKGATGRGDGEVDVGLVAFGDDGKNLFGRGIERLEGPARYRRHAPAVDQKLMLGSREKSRGGRFRGIVICSRHHISSVSYSSR